jgi:hypothetical protein
MFIGGGVALLLWAPWLPTLKKQIDWTNGRFWAQRPGGDEVLRSTAQLLGVDTYAANYLGWAYTPRLIGASPLLTSAEQYAAVAAIVASAAAVLALRDRRTRPAALVGLALVAVPVAVALVRSYTAQPIFMTRIFNPSSPFVALLLALPAASTAVTWRRAGTALVAIFLVGSALTAAGHVAIFRTEDWRGAYAAVREAAQQDAGRTLVVFVANEGEAVFRHSESRGGVAFDKLGLPSGYFDTDPPEPLRAVRTDADLALLRAALASGKYTHIALVLSHETHGDPGNLVVPFLDAACELDREIPLNLVRVRLYAARDPRR